MFRGVSSRRFEPIPIRFTSVSPSLIVVSGIGAAD
jgi:hypothetical protein